MLCCTMSVARGADFLRLWCDAPHGRQVLAKKDENMRSDGDLPIVIKKYPNRRLYNTSTSAYIVQKDIETLVREGRRLYH